MLMKFAICFDKTWNFGMFGICPVPFAFVFWQVRSPLLNEVKSIKLPMDRHQIKEKTHAIRILLSLYKRRQDKSFSNTHQPSKIQNHFLSLLLLTNGFFCVIFFITSSCKVNNISSYRYYLFCKQTFLPSVIRILIKAHIPK